ncbi:DUF4192 domain-containing protein [Streptomyces sp. NPDC047123]|uniref:DUF4192 domain-containing protein n=1 Tax=Streptomyces sp. NPDC047123 TaxID=3155622 RepID=UPI0033C2DBAA
MTNYSEAAGAIGEPMVTLRTPAELADALPYLLGFKPEESIVLVALHGDRGRFGGRVRLGVPERAEDWPCIADQLAQCLVGGCERRGARPEGVIAFLCQEPADGESGRQVMERLRPLAQVLRTACGRLDVPVLEAVCISDGHFWTYCCPDDRCCPPEGSPLLRPGTSVLAAAATYMGVRATATQSEIRGRLTPWATAAATDQERALDAAALALIPRMLSESQEYEEASENEAAGGYGGSGEEGGTQFPPEGSVAAETIDLARRVMARLAAAPLISDPLDADIQDDELLAHDEAAALILGLQVRITRDHAAEWMEGEAALPALRLWRALCRRCVGAYAEHAAATLSLAGWVAWSLGAVAEGQEALDMALSVDPRYAFARLLHQACNEGMDPEAIRRCLRRARDEREQGGERERGREAERPGSPELPGSSGEKSLGEKSSGAKEKRGAPHDSDPREEGTGKGPKPLPRRRPPHRSTAAGTPRASADGPRPLGVTKASGGGPRSSGAPRPAGGPRVPGGRSGRGGRAGQGGGPANRRRTLRRGTRGDR